MKSDERKRVLDNRDCIYILNKDLNDITEEEKEGLRDKYTGYGSMSLEGLAQFYTPKHVSKFLADYINPLLPQNAKVLEPASGNGSLVSFLSKEFDVTCVEIDNVASKILSICNPSYEVINDSAVNFKRSDNYDLVISNPPFNIQVEGEKDGWSCTKFDKKKGVYKANSDNFFIELAIDSLKIGGYGVFILPTGIAFKNTLKKTRQLLLDNCWIIANIELPPETFSASGTNIKTNILIFRKAPKLQKVKGISKECSGEFILGQPPIIQIQVNDIGFDKKGKPTNRYNENSYYENQLDEALERLTDNLYRQNTCPEVGIWFDKGDFTQCIAFNENSRGCIENKRYKTDDKDLIYYQDLTLGRGCDIEYDGEFYETLDWNVMDRLIEKYANT